MSKRITLTDFEIEQIISALNELSGQVTDLYEATRVGRRWYQELVKKLERISDAKKEVV